MYICTYVLVIWQQSPRNLQKTDICVHTYVLMHAIVYRPTSSADASAKGEEDGESCEKWRETEGKGRRRGGGEDNVPEQDSKIHVRPLMVSFHYMQ